MAWRSCFRPALRALGGVGGLLLPRRCLVCGHQPMPAGTGPLCPRCRAALPAPIARPCRWCASPLPPGHDGRARCSQCGRRPAHVRELRAPYAFRGTVRDLIHGFKFGPEAALGGVLGPLLGRAIARLPFETRPDLVVPVPLHRRRRRARGFNQAAVLARHVGGVVGAPVEPRRLVRIRNTGTQVGKGARGRQRNVAGAFRCRSRGGLAGRCVLLVDDVLTTGATLAEAARTLRRAGARSVAAAVVARAGWGDEGGT